jgi:hypothetical protein
VAGINTGRVIVGGLVAGLVLNVSEFILNTVVLGPSVTAAMTRMNLPPMGGAGMAAFAVLGFAVGIVTVWLYAAIRPRYGAGPKTALCAGATVWFFAYLYGGLGMVVMGMFPLGTMAVGMAWGLAEILLASVAGAYFYKE